MAKLEIMIHENTGATKESAPYLGTFVTKDTTKLEALAALVSRKSGLPAIQTQAILKGSFDEFQEMELDAPTRINFDGGYVCQVIRGTFESSDAAFDPAANSLELAFRLADDVKNVLVDATPRIVTDETSTKVRVDNVADVETPRPYQVIHGQHAFKVTGINLVTTDVGAAVWLESHLGVTFPCTVLNVVSKQEFTAKSNALLEGGDYKLWVKSRGGDAEGPLQTSFRKVKYLKVIDPPTVTKVATPGLGGVGKGSPFDIEGTNLAFAAGDSVKAKWTDGGTPGEVALTPASVSATKLGFAAAGAFDAITYGTTLTFEITIGGVTVTKTATLVVDTREEISVGTMTVTKEEAYSSLYLGNVVNAEGIAGYGKEGEGPSHFDLAVSVNGGEPFTTQIGSTDPGNYLKTLETPVLQVGDTVTVTITPDPAKVAEYKQTPVVKTATVTA